MPEPQHNFKPKSANRTKADPAERILRKLQAKDACFRQAIEGTFGLSNAEVGRELQRRGVPPSSPPEATSPKPARR